MRDGCDDSFLLSLQSKFRLSLTSMIFGSWYAMGRRQNTLDLKNMIQKHAR